MNDFDRYILRKTASGHAAIAEIERLRGEVRALQRAALPSDCDRCRGDGSDPPHGPEDGPCQRCGGWTEHKRLVAGEARLLTMERNNAIQARDAEKARADAAEQMVAELRAIISEAADDLDREEDRHASYGDGFDTTALAHTLARGRAALARTEPVAGRWCLAAERDAARAEVARLRAQLGAALATIEAAALSETP